MNSRFFFAFALAFVLLSSSASALMNSCTYEAKNSMPVPAVSGNGDYGRLITLENEIREGSGGMYFSVLPVVGAHTQLSEQVAIAIAMGESGYDKDTCDVLFRITSSEGAESVDGPSAGAAMTLLLISNLQNKTMRANVSITGTIERDGSIGAVGGVVEKTKAAAEKGIKVMLVPQQGIYERIAFAELEGKWPIRVVEVSSIEEAQSVVFASEETPLPEPKKLARNALPDVTALAETNSSEMKAFEKIARKMIEKSEQEIDGITGSENARVQDFRAYFENELEIANTLVEKRFFYTGANTAFLAWADAKFLKNHEVTESALNLRVERVRVCLNSLEKPALNLNNAEFVFGGEAREVWARDKVESFDGVEGKGEEELLSTLRDLIYAENWCWVANEMYKAGDDYEGEELNESLLKGYAQRRIEEAQNYSSVYSEDVNGDAESHIKTAKLAYEREYYGGAV
ncbi:MAG: S16 family serine protease, partial [Candidatus Micrarchaeota archaeon]